MRIAPGEPGFKSANGVLTTQLASDQILALSIESSDALRASEIAAIVLAIERKACSGHSQVVTLFVKPQTGQRFQESLGHWFGTSAAAAAPPGV